MSNKQISFFLLLVLINVTMCSYHPQSNQTHEHRKMDFNTEHQFIKQLNNPKIRCLITTGFIALLALFVLSVCVVKCNRRRNLMNQRRQQCAQAALMRGYPQQQMGYQQQQQQQQPYVANNGPQNANPQFVAIPLEQYQAFQQFLQYQQQQQQPQQQQSYPVQPQNLQRQNSQQQYGVQMPNIPTNESSQRGNRYPYFDMQEQN